MEAGQDAPPSMYPKMGRVTIRKSDYLKAGQLFHWATAEHYRVWFTGCAARRHKRTEAVLPRLVSEAKLVARRFGRRLVYSVPRRCRSKAPNIAHGLACTEGLVRFWRAWMAGEVVPERCFRGLGCVPEWGILYPTGTLLMYEFCTAANFDHAGLVKGKLAKYRAHLAMIEAQFQARGLVVFALDVPRATVARFVRRLAPAGEPFFFTDYDTFLRVPIGEQLTAPIYFWGEDAQAYALKASYGPESD